MLYSGGLLKITSCDRLITIPSTLLSGLEFLLGLQAIVDENDNLKSYLLIPFTVLLCTPESY